MKTASRAKRNTAKRFLVQYNEQDPIRGHAISQRHGDSYVVQTVADMPLSREELDHSYTRHISGHGILITTRWAAFRPIEEVQFSLRTRAAASARVPSAPSRSCKAALSPRAAMNP